MRGRGFSLAELLVVIAIAAILVGIALPSLSGAIRRYQLKATVSDLHGAINLTRSQAIARGSRVQLAPLAEGGADWAGGWVVFVDADGDRRPGPGDEVIASHGPVPDGIVIRFNFTSNRIPYYIAFNGNGRSCSATSSLSARWGTLSLHQDGEIRRIRINMLGRVRVCDPRREPAGCAGPSQGG